ncbi:MAG TPA: hypothetical protein VFB81_21080 [Myxococcales bacterium]|nr:hypothetical protein [Myxococcales bacterium]
MSRRARSFVLLAALWAAPPLSPGARAECASGRMAIVPFEYLAAEARAARDAEQRVRDAAQRRLGGCVEARGATVRRLERLGPSLAACQDDACRAARASALEAQSVLEGIALGMGGGPALALSLWGRDGKATRQLVPLDGSPQRVGRELDDLLGRWLRNARGPNLGPYLVLGAAASALVAGAVFGALMQQTQQAIAGGTACGGVSDDLAACLERRMALGRQQAITANVLFGAGAALAVPGTIWLVWEWQ